MKWRKMGLILKPEGQFDWIITHASLPIAIKLREDMYRLYFSGRDKENRAQPGFIEIDVREPVRILRISPEPILELGKTGLFDDSGVQASCIVQFGDRWYLYYNGWMRGVDVPYYTAIGLAISEDEGKTFSRYSPAPIVDRSDVDPYIVGSPYVLAEDDFCRMWYFSATDFRMESGKPKWYTHIKYAESNDGIHWNRQGRVCIDFKSSNEWHIGRPCVIKENGLYKMWYCYYINTYKIGYAESEDGINWQRKDDEVEIDLSSSGWDSEMICYPFVFEHRGQKYMLYNGNEYGRTGVGYAISEEIQ